MKQNISTFVNKKNLTVNV